MALIYLSEVSEFWFYTKMNNIYIGDIVYLVYGSHPMMVEKLQDNLATCIWFSDKKHFFRENFPLNILIKKT